MEEVYRFADLAIRISSLHDTVHRLCGEYRFDGIPCFAVQVSSEDVALEKEKSEREDRKEGREIIPWPDDYLETLAVYRKMAEKLPEYDGVVFHGSAVAVDGSGYIFTAKSGTGKSTHTGLWREVLGQRAIMVNDDKPIIRVLDVPVVYGTPWDGKHHLSNNMGVPLKAICILERGKMNRIREISRSEALPMLIQQTYRPADPAALGKTITLLNRLDVRFYRLSCNMELSAAKLSYETMRGGKR